MVNAITMRDFLCQEYDIDSTSLTVTPSQVEKTYSDHLARLVQADGTCKGWVSSGPDYLKRYGVNEKKTSLGKFTQLYGVKLSKNGTEYQIKTDLVQWVSDYAALSKALVANENGSKDAKTRTKLLDALNALSSIIFTTLYDIDKSKSPQRSEEREDLLKGLGLLVPYIKELENAGIIKSKTDVVATDKAEGEKYAHFYALEKLINGRFEADARVDVSGDPDSNGKRDSAESFCSTVIALLKRLEVVAKVSARREFNLLGTSPEARSLLDLELAAEKLSEVMSTTPGCTPKKRPGAEHTEATNAMQKFLEDPTDPARRDKILTASGELTSDFQRQLGQLHKYFSDELATYGNTPPRYEFLPVSTPAPTPSITPVKEEEKKQKEEPKKMTLPKDLPTIWTAHINRLPVQDQNFSLKDARDITVYSGARNFELEQILAYLKDKPSSDKLSDYVKENEKFTANDLICWRGAKAPLANMTVQNFRDFCSTVGVNHDEATIHKFDKAVGNICKAYLDRIENTRKAAMDQLAQQSASSPQGIGLSSYAESLKKIAKEVDEALANKELVEELKNQLFTKGRLGPLDQNARAACDDIINKGISRLSGISKYGLSAASEAEEVIKDIKAEIHKAVNAGGPKITDEDLNAITTSLRHIYRQNLEIASKMGVNAFAEAAAEQLAQEYGTPGCLNNLHPAEKLAKAVELAASSPKLSGLTVKVDANGAMTLTIPPPVNENQPDKPQFIIDNELADRTIAMILLLMANLKSPDKIRLFYSDEPNGHIRPALMKKIVARMEARNLDPGILDFKTNKFKGHEDITTRGDASRNKETYIRTHGGNTRSTDYIREQDQLLSGLLKHLKTFCANNKVSNDSAGDKLLTQEIQKYLDANLPKPSLLMPIGYSHIVKDREDVVMNLAAKVANAEAGPEKIIKNYLQRESERSRLFAAEFITPRCRDAIKTGTCDKKMNFRANTTYSLHPSGVPSGTKKPNLDNEVDNEEARESHKVARVT